MSPLSSARDRAGTVPVPARRRTRRAGQPRTDPRHPRTAVVPAGLADPDGARRRLDVRRRHARPAPAVPAPGRDGGGRGALGLPRRPVGPAGADQHVHRDDDLRHDRRRDRSDRPGPPGARADPWRHARRDRVRRERPDAAALGARRRGGQLPARAPRVRAAAPRCRRCRRVRRAGVPRGRRARGGAGAGVDGRAGEGAGGVPARARPVDGGARRGRLPAARATRAAARCDPATRCWPGRRSRRCRRGRSRCSGWSDPARSGSSAARAAGAVATRSIRWMLGPDDASRVAGVG